MIVLKIIFRIFVFLVLWAGVYWLYRVPLGTNWSVEADAFVSFLAAANVFWIRKFQEWFFMIEGL